MHRITAAVQMLITVDHAPGGIAQQRDKWRGLSDHPVDRVKQD